MRCSPLFTVDRTIHARRRGQTAAGAMPDSVRYNIKYLVSNLDVSLILEDLLENDVLSEEEYVTASGKENEKWDLSKYVVRLMLTKTDEQVGTFLNLIQHSQPHVAEHIANTMAKRRGATASGKADHPTKPMSADRESTLDYSGVGRLGGGGAAGGEGGGGSLNIHVTTYLFASARE